MHRLLSFVLPKRLVRWPTVLLLCLGVARSAQISFSIPVDADRATTALVFEAVQRDGPAMLQSWHFTQDNWLLSAIVPQLPLYALLGARPWLPALTGWFGFLAVCCAAGLLAGLAIGTARGARIGALLTAVLLFANPLCLGDIGFLSHPESHGITLAWGLLALAMIVASLAHARRRWLVPASALLLVATVSDPWARASLVLPIDLAAVCLAFVSGRARRHQAACVILATLPVWLAGSHLFGFLPSLPGARFETGPVAAVPDHLGIGLGAVSILLDLIPSIDPLTHRWARLLTFALLVGLLVSSVGPLYRAFRRGRPASRFLLLVCLISAVSTLAAFSMSVMATGFGMGRLLCNIVVFVPLWLVVGLSEETSGLRPVAVAAVFFVLTGLSLDGTLATHPADAARTRRLLAFLSEHRLTYGYGGYWSSEANASRLLSFGGVTIRPLAVLGPPIAQPRDGQVFDSWYRAEDAPPGEGRRFFIAVSDQELCASDLDCVDLAVRSFGTPDRTLYWDGHPILVWDRPILPATPTPSLVAEAPPLSPGTSLIVTPAVAPRLLWAGWAGLGADGAWTVARQAGLMLRLPGGSGALCFDLRASGRPGQPPQQLGVRVGSETLAHWSVLAGSPRSYCCPPPPAGPTLISFERNSTPFDNQRLLPGIQLSAVRIR